MARTPAELEEGHQNKIKVFTRVRPAFPGEFDVPWVFRCIHTETEKGGKWVQVQKDGDPRRHFTHCFGPSARTREVFDQVVGNLPREATTGRSASPSSSSSNCQSLLLDAYLKDGHSGTVILYGQTGTGKTHTLLSSNPSRTMEKIRRWQDSRVTNQSSALAGSSSPSVTDDLTASAADDKDADVHEQREEEEEGLIIQSLRDLYSLRAEDEKEERADAEGDTAHRSKFEVKFRHGFLELRGFSQGVYDLLDDYEAIRRADCYEPAEIQIARDQWRRYHYYDDDDHARGHEKKSSCQEGTPLVGALPPIIPLLKKVEGRASSSRSSRTSSSLTTTPRTTISMKECSSLQDSLSVLEKGDKAREILGGRMASHRGRTHAIFITEIERKDLATGATNKGYLFFVDLAGSERVAKSGFYGDAYLEAVCRSKSLTALGNFLAELNNDEDFRTVDSQLGDLTTILAPALCGLGRTSLVITIRPDSPSMMESCNSLKFAERIQLRPVEMRNGHHCEQHGFFLLIIC